MESAMSTFNKEELLNYIANYLGEESTKSLLKETWDIEGQPANDNKPFKGHF